MPPIYRTLKFPQRHLIIGTKFLKVFPSMYSLIPPPSKVKSNNILVPTNSFAGTFIFEPCHGASSSQFLLNQKHYHSVQDKKVTCSDQLINTPISIDLTVITSKRPRLEKTMYQTLILERSYSSPDIKIHFFVFIKLCFSGYQLLFCCRDLFV